jgi:hypothetical protein
MPAHVKANPVEVSLLRVEAIVFVTKYLAHLLQQALGLGKVGDSVHRIKTMCKITAMTSKNALTKGLQRFFGMPPPQPASLFRRISWNPWIFASPYLVRHANERR